MLNEQQRFDGIKELNDIVTEYKLNGTANITIEQKLMLKEIYQSIYGRNINMDLSCSTCIITQIIFLHSWYVREFPLFLANKNFLLTPAEVVDGLVEPVLSDATGGEPVVEVADEPVAEEAPVEPEQAAAEPVEPVADEPAPEAVSDEPVAEPATNETPVEPDSTVVKRRR